MKTTELKKEYLEKKRIEKDNLWGTLIADALIDGFKMGRTEEQQRILKMVENFENPYPKDIFRWDNKGKLDFNRGRFNQHTFMVVENIKTKLKKQIKEGEV